MARVGLILAATLLLNSLYGAEETKVGRDPSASLAPAADIFERGIIPQIQIEITDQGLEELRKYRWGEDDDDIRRTDIRATVREGTVVYTNVALHLKGSAGSFRPIDSEKPAFTLNFDKFASGQRFHGLQKLHLNNSVQDPSYLSELVCRELFTQAGISTTRVGHALVQVNGKPQQLYVLVEGWNKQFFRRHFNNHKGNLYDGGAAHDITHPLVIESGEDSKHHARFQDLIQASTNETARLDHVLDMERFLTFLAMEVMTVHWDGYAMNRNNYRIFHDLGSDRMVFLPHGMDQMFGVWRSTPTSPITPMMKGATAKALMQVPDGRRRYLERMSQLLTNVFSDVQRLTNRVHDLTARLRPVFKGNEAASQGQQRAAHALASRIALRVASVREQLKEANTPLQFDASGQARLSAWRLSRESGSPSFSQSRGETNTLQVSASGNYAYGSWRTLVLLDSGTYQFKGRWRTDDLQLNGVTRGGVTLRVSGDRTPQMVTNAIEGTEFTYEFSVPGMVDMELVCEFRASRGRVWFETDSLRLVRTGKPPARNQP